MRKKKSSGWKKKAAEIKIQATSGIITAALFLTTTTIITTCLIISTIAYIDHAKRTKAFK